MVDVAFPDYFESADCSIACCYRLVKDMNEVFDIFQLPIRPFAWMWLFEVS